MSREFKTKFSRLTKILRQLIQSLAIENVQFAMTHTALAATFLLPPTVVGNGAINIYGSCIQFRNKLFKTRMWFLSVGKCAINTLRCWNLRNGVCCAVGTSSNTPCFPISKALWILYAIDNCVPSCQQLDEVARYFWMVHTLQGRGEIRLKSALPHS